jgi:hypothetical protein
MASNRDRSQGHPATSGSDPFIPGLRRASGANARLPRGPKSTMNARSQLDSGRRELAHRSADGLEVTLDWAPRTNTLSVAVYDRRTGDFFELVLAPGENPLHVFHHPYAYAAWRGLDYRVPERQAA